jgi:hypothetical protein
MQSIFDPLPDIINVYLSTPLEVSVDLTVTSPLNTGVVTKR